MNQTTEPQTEYNNFIEALTIIGRYNYGIPKDKYPRFVSFQNTDKFFPPDNILKQGSKAIRSYWNNKNLRKRIEVIKK